jgi:GPH family glycoside/pentoside/hexuronide:cation symporter
VTVTATPTNAPRSRDATLDLGVVALYGLGEVAISIRQVLFSLFLLFFYSTVMGLPGTLVGIATAVGFAWNAVVDPLVGRLSDRLAWPLGRRHGLMVIGSIGTGLFAWALFAPPATLAPPVLFAWLLGSSLLLRTASSLFGIPFLALGAELSADYDERNLVTGLRGIVGLVGLVGAASVPLLLFFAARAGEPDPKLSYSAYPGMGAALGAAMIAFGLIATLGTFGRRATRGNQAGRRAMKPCQTGALRELLQSLQSASFRAVLLASSLVFLGTVVNQALAIHFLTYYAQIADNRAVSAIQAGFYGAAGLSVPLWLRVAQRVEKKRLFVIATTVTASLLILARLLIGPNRLFGVGHPIPILIGEVFAGLFASLFWIIPASMVADVADEDEATSGERREGIFFGMFSFGQQIAAGLSALATGVLLDQFAGLVPGVATQSAQTAERIGLIATWLPGISFALAAVAIIGYSLNRAKVAALQRRRAPGSTVSLATEVRPA